MAARCKGTAVQGTWQVSVLIPNPHRATCFECMTECKETGANGYLAEWNDLTGKGRDAHMLHYFLLQHKVQHTLVLKHKSAARLHLHSLSTFSVLKRSPEPVPLTSFILHIH